MTQFLILILTIWRLCVLLMRDNLPFSLMAKFRDRIGIDYDAYGEAYGKNEFAKIFVCIYCMSIWIALPFSLYFYHENFLIYWLALSAGAIIIDKYAGD